MSEQPNKDLEDQARERIQEMPAETALGNRDPEGGGEGDPGQYDEDHAGDPRP